MAKKKQKIGKTHMMNRTFESLNDKEKGYIATYIKEQVNKYISKELIANWNDMEQELFQAMKNNRISELRQQKIIDEVNKRVMHKKGEKIIKEKALDKYIVLSKEEYQNLCAEITDIKCKD